jgi:hypothetical protein
VSTHGNGAEIKNYCIEILRIISSIFSSPVLLRGKHTTLSPSVLFGLKLKDNYASFEPPIKGSDYYSSCRVVPFSSFINPEYNPSILLNNVFPKGLSKSSSKKNQLIYDIENGYKELSNINLRSVTSSTGWVFFTKKDELEKELNNKNLPAIIDITGYYISAINPDEYYISINYPDNFKETVYQPCSLTGDWGKMNKEYRFVPGNDFFLTFKREDTWGRTCSITDCFNEVSERIHKKDNFSDNYKFELKLLGKLKKNIIARDSSTILSIAINRFENA